MVGGGGGMIARTKMFFTSVLKHLGGVSWNLVTFDILSMKHKKMSVLVL